MEKAWEKKSEYAPIDPADKIGWVKIAWTFAFYYLGLTPTIPYRDVYKRSMFYGGVIILLNIIFLIFVFDKITIISFFFFFSSYKGY